LGAPTLPLGRPVRADWRRKLPALGHLRLQKQRA
jgi:hypothetical protein